MKVLFFVIVTFAVIHVSYSGLLRNPRVYNALVTSGDNLAPSRAFPVIQPVLHEAAYGYPLHPLPPYGQFQRPTYGQFQPPEFDHPYFGPYDRNPIDDRKPNKKPESTAPPKEKDDESSTKPEPSDSESSDKPEDKSDSESSAESKEEPESSPPNKQGNPNNYPNANPYDFLPTNEYGLPPSLVPLPQDNYDQFNPFGYSNPPVYYPYNLNQHNYPVLAPDFYNYPNNLGHFGSHHFGPEFGYPRYPQPSEIDFPSKKETKDKPKPADEKEPSEKPSMPPPTGDTKNIMDKNPEIPDVPPPPPPTGADKEE